MRWRPPTRPLILIAVLLLAGAVVNVAVAWLLIGAPDSWTPGGSRLVFDSSASRWAVASGEGDRLDRQGSRIKDDVRVPQSWGVHRRRGLGWMFTSASESGLGSPARTRTDAGWPLHSLMLLAKISSRGDVERSLSLKPPQPLLRAWGHTRARSFVDPRHHLPLTPIPAGFAINTVFYAAILALPLSFFPIRRRLRARRGRCPKCGYDLAGLADPAAPCPECGGVR